MPDPLVAHDDLQMFLTGWYRVAIAARPEDICANVQVSNSEPLPGEPFPEKLVVIRDDGGPDTWFLTGERTVGISVLAGTKENPKDATDLARIVHALRTQVPSADPANPVASVLESNGPYAVPEEQQRARQYSTVTFVVVARAI